jgi:hypothetical protein
MIKEMRSRTNWGNILAAPARQWTVQQKQEAVLRLLRGESVELLSQELEVEAYRLEAWRAQAISGMEVSLKERKGDILPSGTGNSREADR